MNSQQRSELLHASFAPKKSFSSLVSLLTGLTVLSTAEFLIAEGFPIGHLIATDYSSVYAIDPLTGAHQVLLSGQSGLSDIVYNPVTGSAFIGTGADAGGSTILELRYIPSAGFEASTFLDGLDYAHGLAVDQAGNIYYGQDDQRIWKADIAGNITAVTEYNFYYFWTVEYMAFSSDESGLYVSVSPSNEIDVVTFPGAGLSHLTEDINFPRGLDVGADGVVYATDQPTGDTERVVTVSPEGVMTTYLQEPWMSNGLWGDLEFDDPNGAIYVINAYHLYTIDSNKVSSLLFSSPSHLALKGLDFIVVPEPCTLVLLSVAAIGLLAHTCCRSLWQGRSRWHGGDVVD